jgi:HK97 family phage portal protein
MKLFGFEISRAEKRMSPENPRYSLDDPSMMDALWMDAGSMPPVRPQRAVQTSAVYACVRVLSETLASLPLHVYKRNGRNIEKADNLPLYGLLHDEPNSYQTSYVFKEQGQAIASLWGNFYCEIQRDLMTGAPIGLYPLPAGEVQPELARDGNSLRKVYRVGDVVLEDADVLHIPALGWNGLAGVSPIALHRATLTMTLNAEEFGANFFKNGTKLSGVLEHPGKISKEAADRLRASWQDTYAGKANSGKVAILEEDMKFSALTMPLADAQFIEQRRFQVTDIARIFRVPPHMIGDLDRATFSNIEHQSIEFVQNTMLPWVTRWEQEINRKLIPAAQRKRYFVKFDLAELLRGDMKSRYDAYAVARQWGWMSANDVLENEDKNPIEGGDIYLSPMNMVPADQIGKEPPKAPAEPAAPKKE